MYREGENLTCGKSIWEEGECRPDRATAGGKSVGREAAKGEASLWVGARQWGWKEGKRWTFPSWTSRSVSGWIWKVRQRKKAKVTP